MATFKFEDIKLNIKLIKALAKTTIKFFITKDDRIQYNLKVESEVDSLILKLREQKFKFWQILSPPKESFVLFEEYMKKQKIPYVIESNNGEKTFLIDKKYRPLTWKFANQIEPILLAFKEDFR